MRRPACSQWPPVRTPLILMTPLNWRIYLPCRIKYGAISYISSNKNLLSGFRTKLFRICIVKKSVRLGFGLDWTGMDWSVLWCAGWAGLGWAVMCLAWLGWAVMCWAGLGWEAPCFCTEPRVENFWRCDVHSVVYSDLDKMDTGR